MRAHLMDVPIDLLTADETVERAVAAMTSKRLTKHVAINVAKLVYMQRDPELRRDVSDSHIVGVDGMGIVVAARLLGIRVPERVAGVDLMERVLETCAARGFRPYFLGARQDVLDRAAENAARRWPGLVFAGLHDGYFAPEREPEVVDRIRSSGADCLFIGMPTPRKERFLHRYSSELDVPFIMGVGGGLDVLAGHVSRAPQALQRAGLEWLYRIYQEPRRMWWRYLSTNVLFAGMLGRALIASALHGRVSPSRPREDRR
jgi:N-acetylglucosaminyldiphosphoundecaprenol N-acetyl-beta-D-mannosaminyltransferase